METIDVELDHMQQEARERPDKAFSTVTLEDVEMGDGKEARNGKERKPVSLNQVFVTVVSVVLTGVFMYFFHHWFDSTEELIKSTKKELRRDIETAKNELRRDIASAQEKSKLEHDLIFTTIQLLHPDAKIPRGTIGQNDGANAASPNLPADAKAKLDPISARLKANASDIDILREVLTALPPAEAARIVSSGNFSNERTFFGEAVRYIRQLLSLRFRGQRKDPESGHDLSYSENNP
ncbi:MAG: hypothetical protein ACE5IY_22055 [bacterium]